MKSHDQKQLEWNDQASGSEDPKAQVARPGDDSEFHALVDDIREKLKLSPADTSILDVGCGNGLILSELASEFEQISGIDYAEAMISKARDLIPKGDFRIGPATPLPFENNRFSRVLCYSIFHYFPDINYAIETLHELVRVTAPGGIILVGDLLDDKFEADIKGGSNPEIERQRPKIHRYSEWMFYELDVLIDSLPAAVVSAEILEQPLTFKLRHYRKDLRICL